MWTIFSTCIHLVGGYLKGISTIMSTSLDNRDLISPSECCEIVVKALGDVNILNYNIIPLANDVVGFLGEYYKLFVTYSQKNQPKNDVRNVTFFIKSLPIANELQRKEINALGFMKKEITLYKTLFEDMKKYSSFRWHPQIYLDRDDIIVLEDLFQSDFKHMSFNYNSPPEYTRSGLECLAALHASSIVYEAKTGVNIGEKYVDSIYETSLRRENSWIVAGLKAIRNTARLHPNLQNRDQQQFIKDQLPIELEKLFEFGDSFKNYRNTVCHRDLWEKNLLYTNSDKGPRCIFIDFQLTCYSPPGIDFTFFIHLNTNRANRNDNLESYQKYYYDCLRKFTMEFGVDITEHLTWNEFEETIKRYQLIPLALTAIYAPVCFLPDGYLETIKQKTPEKYHHLMHVERNEFVMECIGKFKDVGIRAMEAVAELVEHVYGKSKQV